MYELMVLGLLMQQPIHGFLITKIIDDMIGPVARVSNSRIYPLLARLVSAGQIEVHEERTSENGLPMRIYRITNLGRERFHDLMLDVTSHSREQKELFTIKVTFLSFLPTDERLLLIDRFIDFCRKHMNHFATELADYRQRVKEAPHDPDVVHNVLEAIAHIQEQWESELMWAEKLRAQVNRPLNPDKDLLTGRR